MADQIPLASEMIQQGNEAIGEDQLGARELSEEERQDKEQRRTELVRRCRDYIQSYIEKKAPGKIRYRNNVLKTNNSYVFRYSPPSKRGQRTNYFSQVVIDSNTYECRLEYFRPRRHEMNFWYFPIFYMMNGFTKNPARTFQALGLEPVQNSIRDVFKEKGYRVQYLYNRRIGNVVCVEWDRPEDTQAEQPQTTEEEQPQTTEEQPQITEKEQPQITEKESLEPEDGVPIEA